MNGKHRKVCKLLLLQSILDTTPTYWNKKKKLRKELSFVIEIEKKSKKVTTIHKISDS